MFIRFAILNYLLIKMHCRENVTYEYVEILRFDRRTFFTIHI